jgi:hypothetical protein
MLMRDKCEWDGFLYVQYHEQLGIEQYALFIHNIALRGPRCESARRNSNGHMTGRLNIYSYLTDNHVQILQNKHCRECEQKLSTGTSMQHLYAAL